MKWFIQLFAATLLLTALLAGGFHPDFGAMWHNPMALLGMALIGFGLLRNAQQAACNRE
ncbi:MAG: hypothetical protein AAGH99_12125 [Planctomycetota bacterium]